MAVQLARVFSGPLRGVRPSANVGVRIVDSKPCRRVRDIPPDGGGAVVRARAGARTGLGARGLGWDQSWGWGWAEQCRARWGGNKRVGWGG